MPIQLCQLWRLCFLSHCLRNFTYWLNGTLWTTYTKLSFTHSSACLDALIAHIHGTPTSPKPMPGQSNCQSPKRELKNYCVITAIFPELTQLRIKRIFWSITSASWCPSCPFLSVGRLWPHLLFRTPTSRSQLWKMLYVFQTFEKDSHECSQIPILWVTTYPLEYQRHIPHLFSCIHAIMATKAHLIKWSP